MSKQKKDTRRKANQKEDRDGEILGQHAVRALVALRGISIRAQVMALRAALQLLDADRCFPISRS